LSRSTIVPRVGFDIGGTFTDLILVDDESGSVTVAKVSTTPAEPADGVAIGIRELLDASAVDPTLIERPVNGATTLITNTIIERSGARTALVTTRGFRDVLEIGREWRYDIYDLFQPKLEPLIPRDLRFEVAERIGPDGIVSLPLDLDDLEQAATRIESLGVEAVAICFINAYANSEHEDVAAAWLRSRLPKVQVVSSAAVAPEIREYERSSTAAACAYVAPGVGRHFHRLQQAVRECGVGTDVYLMHSSGGLVSLDTAARFPIKLVESGPAAGVLGAAFVGGQIGVPNLLSFDMGGTTAKICCIDAGEPAIVNDFEAARLQRFKRGSGIPLLVPVVDLTEIGAGGGSIARVDSLNLLKVGPQSAGAVPGPVCYGRGGTEPTVTDADLVLGYLDPRYFLGGRMAIDPEAAGRAIAQSLAPSLGVDAVTAAAGIVRVVNENMANAAKIHLAERGRDPRAYSLVAFGGAGAIHGGELARALGIGELIYPIASGALSALGLLAAPIAIDFQQTSIWRLDELPWDSAATMLAELEQRGADALSDTGADPDACRSSRTVEMRYVGQGYSVTVQLPDGTLSAESAPEIARRFDETYEALYGNRNPGIPLELTTWRIVVEAPGSQPVLRTQIVVDDLAAATKGTRPIYSLSGGEFVEATVYDHYLLAPGTRIEGPAVVEQRESTCVLAAGDRAWIDDHQNVRVEVARHAH
jgi:N-methylhydantoinase A